MFPLRCERAIISLVEMATAGSTRWFFLNHDVSKRDGKAYVEKIAN